MNYYEEIKNKIKDNEIYGKVKDYSKERYRIITYFEIGKLLNETGGKYGDNIIDEYSRIPFETKEKIINNNNLKVQELVPNPILIRNKKNVNIINEKTLHQLILENITSFMKD